MGSDRLSCIKVRTKRCPCLSCEVSRRVARGARRVRPCGSARRRRCSPPHAVPRCSSTADRHRARVCTIENVHSAALRHLQPTLRQAALPLRGGPRRPEKRHGPRAERHLAVGSATELRLVWYGIWRHRTRDAVLGPPLIPIRGLAGRPGRLTGHRAIIGLAWHVTRSLALSAEYARFEVGGALRRAGATWISRRSRSLIGSE